MHKWIAQILQKYNHEYLPGVGDGIVDQIFFLWRDVSINLNGTGGYKPAGVNFTSHNGVNVVSTSGIMMGNLRNYTPLVAVKGPAHEYCHFLFSGTNNNSAHWDGNAGATGNFGRIYMFGLEVGFDGGYMNSYERYRLGWLNPTIIQTNTSYFILEDSYKKNKALILPLKYDVSTGWLKEFYLIENYETQLVNASCNPFMSTNVFNYAFYNGLIVYHIWDQDYYFPTQSKIKIETADGNWQWKLIKGANTPNDRTDDLMGKDYTLRFGGGFSERDFININVGGVIYNDYLCLNPNDDPSWPIKFPGAHYSKDTWLGKYDDLFRLGYNETFTRYSNPATIMADGTPANIGFKILSYNTTTREYALSLQFDNASVLALNPSKPQNLKITSNTNAQAVLTWDPWYEPTMNGGHYKIFRASNPTTLSLIATINSSSGGNPVTTWTDEAVTVGSGTSRFYYKISAVDNTSKESVQSDTSSINYNPALQKTKSNSTSIITDFKLEQNYPNPFNPSTQISFSILQPCFTQLKIYDVFGKEITTLVNGFLEEGTHSYQFDGKNLASGVYFYTLKAGNYTATKKMIMTK
jgi:hypothetical protein